MLMEKATTVKVNQYAASLKAEEEKKGLDLYRQQAIDSFSHVNWFKVNKNK